MLLLCVMLLCIGLVRVVFVIVVLCVCIAWWLPWSVVFVTFCLFGHVHDYVHVAYLCLLS